MNQAYVKQILFLTKKVRLIAAKKHKTQIIGALNLANIANVPYCVESSSKCFLFTDACVSEGKASIRGVIRDEDGNLIVGYHKTLNEMEIINVELRAIKWGLIYCQYIGIKNVTICLDSWVGINLLK